MPKYYKSIKTGNEYCSLEYCSHGYGGTYKGNALEYTGLKDLPADEYPFSVFEKNELADKFNIRVLYHDGLSPKLKHGMTTDIILWNVITFYYHECFDELEDLKKKVASSNHFMASYLNNCINIVYNEMSAFCNEHKVPDPRPWKNGEMIPLPIDEYPIWFDNLEDFIADLTWSNLDKKILMKEVLPKLLNSFVHYKDVISETDFSVKDSGEVDKIIDDVIKSNPDIVENYKKGKTGLINKLFGEVMKASGGKVNVKEAREKLENRLKS